MCALMWFLPRGFIGFTLAKQNQIHLCKVGSEPSASMLSYWAINFPPFMDLRFPVLPMAGPGLLHHHQPHIYWFQCHSYMKYDTCTAQLWDEDRNRTKELDVSTHFKSQYRHSLVCFYFLIFTGLSRGGIKTAEQKEGRNPSRPKAFNRK